MEFDPAGSDKEGSWHGAAVTLFSARVKSATFRHSPLFELAANAARSLARCGRASFETPWQIRRAGIQSLEKDRPSIPPTGVLPSCAIRLPRSCAASTACATMRTREILVTVGGWAIDNTIRAIVNVGDEVLIPEPSLYASR